MAKKTLHEFFKDIPDNLLGQLMLAIKQRRRTEGYDKEGIVMEILGMASRITEDERVASPGCFETFVLNEAAVRFAANTHTGAVCEDTLKRLLNRLLRYRKMLLLKAPSVISANEDALSRKAIQDLFMLLAEMAEDMRDTSIKSASMASPCYFCGKYEPVETEDEELEIIGDPNCAAKHDMSYDAIRDRGTSGCVDFSKGGVLSLSQIDEEKAAIEDLFSVPSLEGALKLLGKMLLGSYDTEGACLVCKGMEPTETVSYCSSCGRMLAYSGEL